MRCQYDYAFATSSHISYKRINYRVQNTKIININRPDVMSMLSICNNIKECLELFCYVTQYKHIHLRLRFYLEEHKKL